MRHTLCVEVRQEAREAHLMGLSVCPIAIVAAPVETVWALLDNPTRLDEWVDGRIEWIVPEGPTTPGQKFCIKSNALGRSWRVIFTVKEVILDRHTLQMDVVLPLGMALQERLICTHIDATSCRVQYG